MLLDVLSKESSLSLSKIAVFAVIAGLSDALIVVVINQAAEKASRGESNVYLLFFFALTLGIYILSQKYILRITAVEIEAMISKLRVRLADKIRNADLLPLEKLGRAEIYSGITKDTTAVSQAAAPIIIAVQAALMVFFTIFYIGYLSFKALLLTVGVIAIGVSVHFGRLRHIMGDLRKSSEKENEFFESLTHLIDGFKEVKLNHARSIDLFTHIKRIAAAAAELKTKASVQFADQYLFSQTSLNVLIASVVFVLPLFAGTDAVRILAITAAVQFISGPLTSLVGAIPVFTNANVSMANIRRMEQALEQLRGAVGEQETAVALRLGPPSFNRISLDRISLTYRDQNGEPTFGVGPVSLSFRSGDVLFLVGGNGSGKTTFLKLLTGLYYPDAGAIRIDGVDVEEVGYARYRELFSAIFTDYHLFDRLYGMENVEEKQVTALLELMQLENKTRFVDGRFETQELSSGQKKRLALIVSILENKPIYVFDEWAADQDPQFREFFYQKLLAEFKRRGKTIIAATHDDRFFHLADKVIKMEMGHFVPVRRRIVQ
jgi:putative ATP-binding cassette transporter